MNSRHEQMRFMDNKNETDLFKAFAKIGAN